MKRFTWKNKGEGKGTANLLPVVMETLFGNRRKFLVVVNND
jgi:hypothetical protein